MTQRTVNVGDHFHKVSDSYQQVVLGTNRQLYQNVRLELEKHLRGVVLDIGNGNVFNYDLDRLDKVIAVDLAFRNMKDSSKVNYFSGDARNLNMAQDHSCDYVLMQFLVHHIVDRNKKMTGDSIARALSECHRVLKIGGKLIIVEMLVTSFVETLENILYSLTYKLLTLLNKPMVKFYSRLGLIARLKKAGFSDIIDYEIDMGKWIDPFEALFPGAMKLPRFLYPAQCRLISSMKSRP